LVWSGDRLQLSTECLLALAQHGDGVVFSKLSHRAMKQ